MYLTSELGHFALTLAMAFTIAQIFVPAVGVWKGSNFLQRTAVPLSFINFTLVLFSFALLVRAFLQDDFSLSYAAQNSNSLLPWYYKFSAVWGAHEGSMLLWLLVLMGWTLAVALFSSHLAADLRATVLSVQAAWALGFGAFILFTSNPFDRVFPFPLFEGADLNPFLQDIGLIVHPPILYMGYVGLSVAYSFAVAALVLGRWDKQWAAWLRPWTNTAWAFLTLGIALGSWWAYYELGWGGWWFWDPVENASFMPWLLATALVHSIAVSQKRDLFKRWTLMLALSAFSLSLLGTFLVRSGVLTSVHSFASDPTRGLYILIFLMVAIGSSLLLYAMRVKQLKLEQGFSFVSREAALLINNFLLVVFTIIVLFGTLAPLFFEMFELGSISIGAPYFNLMGGLVALPFLLLLALGQRLRWRQDKLSRFKKSSLLLALAIVLIGLVLGWLLGDGFSYGVAIGGALSSWIFCHSVVDVYQRLNPKDLVASIRRLPLHIWAMHTAHLGMAVLVVGVMFSGGLGESRDVRFAEQDSYELSGYTFYLDKLSIETGPNYRADQARFVVSQHGEEVATFNAQKRFYTTRQQTMTEAGIDGNLWRDLYVSLGEPLEAGTWAVRLHVKPFIRWIWYGALLMAIGGLMALGTKRKKPNLNTSSAEVSQ